MRTRYKGLLLFFALLAVFLFFIFSGGRKPPASGGAISLTFLGYTNPPGNQLRFALFSISNQVDYVIRWRGDWVEVDGNLSHRARIANPTLPGYAKERLLRDGRSFKMAIGEPSDSSENGRWRFVMTYARYTLQERWFDFLVRHKLPMKIGPIVLVNSQSILSPTNNATVRTEWLHK